MFKFIKSTTVFSFIVFSLIAPSFVFAATTESDVRSFFNSMEYTSAVKLLNDIKNDLKTVVFTDITAKEVNLNSSLDINWTITGTPPAIYKIILIDQDGATTTIKTIATTVQAGLDNNVPSTPNLRKITWNVPESLSLTKPKYTIALLRGKEVTSSFGITVKQGDLKINTINLTGLADNGTTIKQGKNLTIQYSAKGIKNVKIELLKGDDVVEVIKKSVSANESGLTEIYAIPGLNKNTKVTAGSDYSVKISDTLNSSISEKSSKFTIQKVDMSFITLSPLTSNLGDVIEFKWNASYPVPNSYKLIAVKKVTFATTTIKTITNDTTQDNSTKWKVPEDQDLGEYSVHLIKGTSEILNSIDSLTIGKGTRNIDVALEGSDFVNNIVKQGKQLDIKITPTDVQDVKVELLKNGSVVKVIDSSVSVKGTTKTVSYSIPKATEPGKDYSIKVTSTKNSGISKTSTTFEIAKVNISFDSNMKSSIGLGENLSIQWTFDGLLPVPFDVLLVKDSSKVKIATITKGDDKKVSWIVPENLSSGDYTLKLIKSDSDLATTKITITTGSRKIDTVNLSGLVKVANVNTIKQGKILSIQFSSIDVSDVKIDLLKDGNVIEEIKKTTPSNSTGKTITYTIPFSFKNNKKESVNGSNYRIKVTSIKNSEITKTSESFDIAKPEVSFYEGMATSVVVNNKLVIDWSATNNNSAQPVPFKINLVKKDVDGNVISTTPITTITDKKVFTYVWQKVPATLLSTSETSVSYVLQIVKDDSVLAERDLLVKKSLAINNDVVNNGQVLGDYVECVDITRNLHRGVESSQVMKLQTFLNQKGFLTESPTKFYGDKTIEAVKDYQSSKGLMITGMVYDLTRQSIKEDTCQ